MTFAEFYPFYLSEHANRTTRRLHFAGSALALVCLMLLMATGDPVWLGAALVSGYGLAWISHLTVEKNRPATFRHPLYSFMGDWKMFWQMLTGRIPFLMARGILRPEQERRAERTDVREHARRTQDAKEPRQ